MWIGSSYTTGPKNVVERRDHCKNSISVSINAEGESKLNMWTAVLFKHMLYKPINNSPGMVKAHQPNLGWADTPNERGNSL